MSDFKKKQYPADCFRGEVSLQESTWGGGGGGGGGGAERVSCTEKENK